MSLEYPSESGLANKTFGHCNCAIIGSFLQKIWRWAPYQTFFIKFNVCWNYYAAVKLVAKVKIADDLEYL